MSSVGEIVYGLENPYPFRPCQNYFRLEGWALIRGGEAPTHTRIRVGEKRFKPEGESPRSDVAARYPDDPYAECTGFTFVCFLPFGNHEGQLEASNDDGTTWHIVKSFVIPVSSHPLMGGFEPAGTAGRLTDTTRLAGWCWHPEFVIDQVVVLFGNTEVPVDFGLSRPDVLARFPDQPQSEFSGFMTRENLPRGKGTLRLQVTTTCGRIYFLDPDLQADLPAGAYAPPREDRDMWGLDVTSHLRTEREALSVSVHPEQPAIGPTNILFVLYGDFTSNSAHHVAAFANELIGRGFDCIVAVPDHMETIGAQPQARFLGIEYADLAELPTYYRDGRAPAVVHAWTTRESVRQFCTAVVLKFSSQVVIHLEDNEREILSRHLHCEWPQLVAKPTAELDALVPPTLSHPVHAETFLNAAQGVTVIVDQLAEFVPKSVPHATLWPAASAAFSARPPHPDLRRRLGIPLEDIVLFYHGNVHQANADEVGELYRAVAQLNAEGHPTWLVRTGRDSPAFTASLDASTRARVIEIGFVKRAKDLPEFMRLADFFVQPGEAGDFNDYRFPSKLPEFLALGRPVILPRSNLGHLVIHGQDAYVLDRADASSIAQAVMTLRNDPVLTAKLAAGALEFSKANFSWARSTDRLLEFYYRVTHLGRPNPTDLSAAQTVSRAFAD